jgi:hypothetical protein
MRLNENITHTAIADIGKCVCFLPEKEWRPAGHRKTGFFFSEREETKPHMTRRRGLSFA